MKEITFVSGKGGVGKTTITASFALLLNDLQRKILAVDADADAPNLRLILSNKEISRAYIKATEKAVINYEKCTSCGICIDHCPEGAIIKSPNDNKIKIIPVFCEGCGVCNVACPEKAIDMMPYETGYYVHAITEHGFPIVTGHLKLGESGSGKFVYELRNKARSLAKEYNTEYILIDGPPGSSCTAIAAITGVNFVVLITEPTPASISDLKRIYKIVKHFRIPHALIINKADLSEKYRKYLYEFAENEKIKILGEIPLDKNIPKAIAHAKTIIEFSPDANASKAIKDIFYRFSKII